MNNTKEVTITHEIINFKVPAQLKMEFEEACYKDQRTMSQQLRVLMLEYIARETGWSPRREEFEKAEKNISNSKLTKHIKSKHNFTRGK